MENLKDTEKFIIYKEGEDLPTYISKLVSWIERFVFNRISKRVNFLLLRMEDGTADGQMYFWDNTNKRLVHTETSELFYDDVNKTLGIGQPTPNSGSKLDVAGTVVVTRVLAGGVKP